MGSTFSQISGAIVASGQIEVDQNRQVVQHPDGGVIAELFDRRGRCRYHRQPLLRLDPTLELSELSIIEDQLYELFARRGRLEAERDGTQDISFEPELIEAAQRDASIKELLEVQIRLFDARSASIANQVEATQQAQSANSQSNRRFARPTGGHKHTT